MLRSESITSYNIIFKHDIDYKHLTTSSEELKYQIENVNLENIDGIEISENTDGVVG